MRPAAHHLASALPTPTPSSCRRYSVPMTQSVGQIRHAIAAAIGAFDYSGCAERVAQEFGDHPENCGRPDALGPHHGRRGDQLSGGSLSSVKIPARRGR